MPSPVELLWASFLTCRVLQILKLGYLIRSVRSTITIGFFRAVGSLICRSPTTIALILLDLADRRSRSDLSCVPFTKILLHDHDRRTRPSAIPHDDHDRRSRLSPSHIRNTIDDHDRHHLISRTRSTITIIAISHHDRRSRSMAAVYFSLRTITIDDHDLQK